MPKPTDPQSLPVAAKKPRVNVLERRRLNPFGEPSSPIDLRDKDMVCRVFNRGVNPQQIYRAKQLGWEYVEPSMVLDVEQAGGFVVSTDGQRMVRGEKEQEVLMFMPKADRQEIEMSKARRNVKDMQMGRQKDSIAQAASQKFGDQAGEFINKGRIVGDVTDNYERIQVTPETE